MDRFSKEKMVQVIQILTKLTAGYKSRENYNSREVGFFAHDEGKVPFEIGFENLDELPESLNNSVKLMYEVIGDPNKEVYLGGWTLMSLKGALEKYEFYKSRGQEHIFDFAHEYAGMGHINVVSCDLKTHQLFYRPDGGSNGYDREYNQQKTLTMDPSQEPQHYFTDWFNYIQVDN
tara:strand:- start:2291 stop:2818 length:528 start_codon:yes stop_codon:yes gene_type:complete